MQLAVEFWVPSVNLQNEGKLWEAIKFEKNGLQFSQSRKHPDLIYNCYRRLGSLHRRLSQLDKAQLYVELGLKFAKTNFTEASANLPNAYGSCALVYLAQEDYEKAEQSFLTEKDIRKRNGHKYLDYCMINLAILYTRTNKFDVAEKYYLSALEDKRRRFPAGDPDYYAVYANLVEFYYNFGDYEKALVYADSSYQILKENRPPSHEDIGDHFNNISVVYQAKGDYREAAKTFQKAIDVYKLKEEVNQERLANTYASYGYWLYETGDYNQALLYFQKSLSIRTDRLEPEHSLIGRTQNYIGNCYLAKNDLDAAEFWMNKALIIRENNREKHPTELSDSYQDIGKLEQKIGFWKAALKKYEQALAINLRVYKTGIHPTLSQNYLEIGRIYLSQNEYQTAADNFPKALSISQKVYNRMHPEVAEIYRNLAACYPNQLKVSQKYLNKAFEAVGYNQQGGLEGIISLTELLKILQTQARLLQDDEKNRNYLIHLLEAEEIYNEAFQLMDSIKVSFTELGSKQSLLDNYFSIYEDGLN